MMIKVPSVAVRLWPLAAVTILLASACLAQVQSGPQGKAEKLPEGVSKVRKEHLLTKIPNFFCFDYDAEPQPGRRIWMRVDDNHFIERYPDGLQSTYRILGRMKIMGESGTVVVKIAGDPAMVPSGNSEPVLSGTTEPLGSLVVGDGSRRAWVSQLGALANARSEG